MSKIRFESVSAYVPIFHLENLPTPSFDPGNTELYLEFNKPPKDLTLILTTIDGFTINTYRLFDLEKKVIISSIGMLCGFVKKKFTKNVVIEVLCSETFKEGYMLIATNKKKPPEKYDFVHTKFISFVGDLETEKRRALQYNKGYIIYDAKEIGGFKILVLRGKDTFNYL